MRLLALGILFVASLSGCIDAGEEFYGFDPTGHYSNPGVFIGNYGVDASPLVLGNLTNATPEVVYLESTLPHYGPAGDALSGNAAAGITDIDSKVLIPMAIWRPENATEPVPIIVDAGPYYEWECKVTPPPGEPCPEYAQFRIDDMQQTTPYMLRNFLPHGYAVVQLAVRGTGTAGGCMDLIGPSEQHDLVQAIDWLAEQEWSNGNVAMVGGSYDGSTQWAVAATGNPHLKTIVPSSGLSDWYDLMFHNGSAETRGPVMHSQVYWGFGFSDGYMQELQGTPAPFPPGLANGREAYQDNQNLACDEVVEGMAMGQFTTTSGGRGGEASTYWVERDYRQRVLDNYKGSVFMVHGLQDWNVDPHVAIPFNRALRDAGIEMKEWYGQWGHDSPNGECGGYADPWVVTACRADYGEVLRRWFDHYLKGNETEDLGPSIQVQDNIGFWRNAESFPPRDIDWTEMHLGADGLLGGDAAGEFALRANTDGAPGDALQLLSDPLEEELHLSGLPQLKLPFSTEEEGGHIAAWLFDIDPAGMARAPDAMCIPRGFSPVPCDWKPVGIPVIAHAQMNLLYHAGGEELSPMTPGERYVAQLQFEPLEVRVPAGHQLGLWVFQYHYEEHRDSDTPSAITVYLDDEAQLRLPAIDVDPRTVFPVPAVNFLNHTYVPEMYVHLPDIPAASMVVPSVPQATPVDGPVVTQHEAVTQRGSPATSGALVTRGGAA